MSKLLFVLNIGFDRPGPSVHLLQDVIEAGLEEGNSIDVILTNTGGNEKDMPDRLACSRNLRYRVIKASEEKSLGFAGRYYREICYAKKCYKVAAEWKQEYDGVFIQSTPAALFYVRLFRKLKTRIVLNVQDIFPYNLMYSGQLPLSFITFPLFRALQHKAYLKTDKIITISDDMKQTLIEDGINSDKIEVVYNWSYGDTPITLETINTENVYDLHLNRNKFNVIYAGNIGKMQNVELIANAARLMKDDPTVQFYIIGDGANKNNVKQIVDGLNNVTMLPMQPSKYAESIYAQADLNVIPLAPGGIKTALPSKTATVLRVNKPVALCIDLGSKAELMFSSMDGVYICDCTREHDVLGAIQRIKRTNVTIKRDECKLMGSGNKYKYIDLMTSE